ncbi:hypothetical protein BTO04_14635 [Polaribacter sp. SA4-10]|uniref:hypothetical protein n=1 Tax=Polaribacter sp. SA4-10 TaxID=754397 RepID=UPI000B3D1430|nr:hypothetical protein [Polaribacter sp. SA4-10]ARV07858.1 hypothetical protein BTO04_14635 [Polaribacter sp. SA4-10]
MVNKNILISKYQNRKKFLKEEIINIKKRLPTFIIGFSFFTFVAIYFLEDKLYAFFGNGVNYNITGVILIGFFCLIFVYKSLNSVSKKEKEIKALSSKLYDLMKLEKRTNE